MGKVEQRGKESERREFNDEGGDSRDGTKRRRWNREGEGKEGEAEEDEEANCNEVEEVLKTLNIGSMVVGHTVQQNINSKCDSKLWRVDIGLSSIFDKHNMSVLEILDDGVKLPRNKFKPVRVLR